jgi:aerobic carbon-monoxide dehydrogenase large subunit
VVIEVKPEGRVDMIIGTAPSGQGHETSFSQVLSDMLGVPFDCIDVRMGDTAFVKLGGGSNSSRSMRIGTMLMDQTKDKIIARGKEIASQRLEASANEIEFADGVFRVVGTDRSIGIFEVAKHGTLSDSSDMTRMLPTFPNGCHVCEVEIDPETGAVEICAHIGVDDVGRVINPLLVDGQTHGGIVQGIGQALMENSVHDPHNGQMLTGTFMDYAVPRAIDVPFFKLHNNEVPAPNNPLGIKGAGEGGTTGAPPAVMNAILDALREAGVTDLTMPATPERIWRALKRA